MKSLYCDDRGTQLGDRSCSVHTVHLYETSRNGRVALLDLQRFSRKLSGNVVPVRPTFLSLLLLSHHRLLLSTSLSYLSFTDTLTTVTSDAPPCQCHSTQSTVPPTHVFPTLSTNTPRLSRPSSFASSCHLWYRIFHK